MASQRCYGGEARQGFGEIEQLAHCIGGRNNLIDRVESGKVAEMGRSYQTDASKREYGRSTGTNSKRKSGICNANNQ